VILVCLWQAKAGLVQYSTDTTRMYGAWGRDKIRERGGSDQQQAR